MGFGPIERGIEAELTQAQSLRSAVEGRWDSQERKERCKSGGELDAKQQQVQTKVLQHEEQVWECCLWGCIVWLGGSR